MTPQQEGRAGIHARFCSMPFAFHNISYANHGYGHGAVPSGFCHAIASDVRRCRSR